MAEQFIESTLMDGYIGGPHITETQTGLANQGLYGPDDYVLSAGRKAEAQILTNNSIRIFDAVFVIQGRRDVIAANDYTDVSIDNGAQGMNRNDIIVRRYTKDERSEIENTEYAVIKGTPTSGEAEDPVVTTGDIRSGALEHEMKLYRVKLEGLNIVAVEPLFQVLLDMSTLNAYLAELSGNLYEDLTQYYTVNWAWEFDRLEVIRTGRLVHIAFICHPKDSWSADQIYTVFTSKIPNKYKPRDLIYSLGVKMNGDATDVNNCAFIANPNGSIQIAVGDKVTSGYFLCDMTYACVWDS